MGKDFKKGAVLLNCTFVYRAQGFGTVFYGHDRRRMQPLLGVAKVAKVAKVANGGAVGLAAAKVTAKVGRAAAAVFCSLEKARSSTRRSLEAKSLRSQYMWRLGCIGRLESTRLMAKSNCPLL